MAGVALSTLNETKTEPVLFSTPKNRVPPPPPLSINICGFHVSTSINIHDLGVQLDPTMSMATYVSRTCRTAYAHLRGIARILSSLPLRVRKSLYTRLSRRGLSISVSPFICPLPLSLVASKYVSFDYLSYKKLIIT